jgi:hypothetical protein
MTATVIPAWATGWLIIPPIPVVTQQPIKAATGIGILSGMGWQACSGHTIDSENIPSLLIWLISVSPSWSLAVPSKSLAPVSRFVSHRFV